MQNLQGELNPGLQIRIESPKTMKFGGSGNTNKGASINDVDPFLGFFEPPGTPNRPKSTFMDPPLPYRGRFQVWEGGGGSKIFMYNMHLIFLVFAYRLIQWYSYTSIMHCLMLVKEIGKVKFFIILLAFYIFLALSNQNIQHCKTGF